MKEGYFLLIGSSALYMYYVFWLIILVTHASNPL